MSDVDDAKHTENIFQDSSKLTNLQIGQLVEVLKEKYSDEEITKYLGSKGITYKYSTETGVDLILEKDRVILRAWTDYVPLCIISNPLPRDIFDNCPFKW